MSKRDEYQTHIEEELNLWTARLAALKGRPDAKAEQMTQLESWSALGVKAFTQLAELKATTGDAWDIRKAAMEETWHGMRSLLAPDAPAKASTPPVPPVPPVPTPMPAA